MAKNKDVKERHHYRPAEHLNAFSAGDKRLWVYDKTGNPPFKQIPQNIGFERFLYAPGVGPDPKDDAVENWFERTIDTPSIRPLRLLLDGVPVSNVEKLRFARFLGMQDIRTPRARDYLLRSYQAHLDAWYAEWTKDIPRLQENIQQTQGTRISIAELSKLVGQHYPEAQKPDWLNFLEESLSDSTGRIIQMRWQMVDAPSTLPFLTSDLGIVKFIGGFNHPCPWRIGFSRNVTHWFVPLSNTRGLAISPPDDLCLIKVTSRLVKEVNKRLVHDAYRFVYSTDPHDFILKWWANPEPQVDDELIPQAGTDSTRP